MTMTSYSNFDSHELFVKRDFTQEEIDRRNVLAVAVILNGVRVCKRCGRTDDELYAVRCSEKVK